MRRDWKQWALETTIGLGATISAIAIHHTAPAHWREFAWTLLLVPTALLAYYLGVRGGFAAAAVAALVVYLSPDVHGGALLLTELDLKFFVSAFVVVPSIAMGVLAHRLRAERARVVRLNAQIAAISARDGLTNLLNHTQFQRAMKTSCKEGSATFSLLVIDVNGFKQVNDVMGHAIGDICLRSLAERLTTSLRTGDLAFRYGGDEFAALLPGVDARGVVDVVGRVRHVVERDPVSEDLTVRLSVAIGSATFPEDGETPDTLFATADARMYQDKARSAMSSR